jgi:arginine-tRNA-protein transferase
MIGTDGKMTQALHRPERFFFGTRVVPCPYIPGRAERKVVTELSGADVGSLYDRLTRAGFRRSHGLAYRPACSGCAACVPVRIVADAFAPGASMLRIARRNRDLFAKQQPALATSEQYQVFLRYQNVRHAGGDMAAMTFADYQAMIEDTPIETRVIEYRDRAGRLLGAMLADELSDSYSAVYSFFEPAASGRSLGTYMILDLVATAKRQGRAYVYLGYWIEGSAKMAYKVRFRPLERLGPDGWELLSL